MRAFPFRERVRYGLVRASDQRDIGRLRAMTGFSEKEKREGHQLPSPELAWEASGKVGRKSLGITLPPVSVAMTFRSESDGTCFPVSIRDSDGFDTPIRRDSSSSVMPFSSLYARSGFVMWRKLLYTQSLRQAKLRIASATYHCVWRNFSAIVTEAEWSRA